MISIFTEVYAQIAQGAGVAKISNPSQLLPNVEPADTIQNFRKNVIQQLDSLLSSELFANGPTVREELSSVAQSTFRDLKARLKTRMLDNEKLADEALKILEEVEHVKENRQKTRAETEAIQLDNLNRKIDILERTLALADRIEPSAIVQLGQSFLPGQRTNAIALPRNIDEGKT